MTDLVIAISGSQGGSSGPQGIYQVLQNYWNDKLIKILSVTTVPEDVNKNVQQISEIALESLQSYENIYFIGYSMGGAVAALVAYQLNTLAEGRVKGVVFLATQTDGLVALKELKIPVLFYHGQNDECILLWQIESWYAKYQGPKKMIQLEKATHDFSPKKHFKLFADYTNNLAQEVAAEMSQFLFQQTTEGQNEQVVVKNIYSKSSNLFAKWRGYFKL